MECLKDMCLKSVCHNLELNSQLITFKTWRFSSRISDLIYSYYIKNIEEIKEKDWEIFFLPFIDITSLVINRKFYDFPQFFSKIPIKTLKEISLFTDFDGNPVDCLQNILKRVCSFEIINLNFLIDAFPKKPLLEDKIIEIFSLIINCVNLTTEIRLKFSNFSCLSGKCFEKFLNVLKNCKNLKILEITKLQIVPEKEIIFDGLDNLSSLQELYLTLDFPYYDFDIFLKNLTNLRVVFIILRKSPTSLNVEGLTSSIFDGLLASKSTLRELKLDGPFDYLHCTDFIKNFEKLQTFFFSTELSISMDYDTNPSYYRQGLSTLTLHQYLSHCNIKNLIDSLEKRKQNFVEIIIYEIFEEERELEKKLNELSKYCKNHLKVYLLITSERDLQNVRKSIENCKKVDFSLEINIVNKFNEAFLSGLESLVYKIKFCTPTIAKDNIRTIFQRCNMLKIVKLEDLLSNKISPNICMDLLKSSKTLQHISFLGGKLGKENKRNFLNLLRNCTNLRIINILNYSDEFVDEEILNEFEKFSSSLTELRFCCSIKYSNNILKLVKKLLDLKSFVWIFFDMSTVDDIFKRLTNIFSNHFASKSRHRFIQFEKI